MTRFTDTVATTLPKGAGESVRAVASAQHATVAHYLRTAIMDRLKADAGTLYNETSEGRSWALVRGDEIRAILPPSIVAPDAPEGFRVLPVRYEDSEPFDHTIHHRLAPVASIRGEEVVRTYPVVAKEAV